MPVAGRACRAGYAARAAVPGLDAHGHVRDGVLLGRREEVLGAPGRLLDAGGLRGRHHAQPDLPRGLLGRDRSHGGRARRVRPGEGHVRGAAARVLGEPRSDPGDAPGQRRGHPVSIGHLRRAATRSGSSPRCRWRRTRRELTKAGHGAITTEIAPLGEFFYAEDYHQQYLAKNPDGYCGIGGTGVSCPVGLAKVGDAGQAGKASAG